MCVYFAGAFTDGRVTICITKFDVNYEQQTKMLRRSRNFGEKAVTAEDAVSKVIRDIELSTNIKLQGSSIVPLSGKWALTCSMLKTCILGDLQSDREFHHDEAVKALQLYPDLSLCGGQGQRHDKLLADSSEKDIMSMLEIASGIKILKER